MMPPPVGLNKQRSPRSLAASSSYLLPAALLLSAVLWVGCGASSGSGGENPDQEDSESTVPAVEVVQARYGALPLQEQLSGTVRATGQVQVYPERSGQLVSVNAQNGDYVEEGQPLARISAQGTQAQLAQAEASLASAQAQREQAAANLQELQAQFKRTQALAKDSLVSQQTLETQRAQVESAKANLAAAEAQVQEARGAIQERSEAVGQTVVRAPISGHVGQRNAEVGMQAGGETPLFIIGDLSKVRVEVPVTQEMLGRIEEGQTARINVGSAEDTTLVAEVSRISPFLESGTYSAEAEIDVPNEGGVLRPGMFVNVNVAYGESRQATLVPMSALYEDPNTGVQGVYVAPTLGEELQVRPDGSSEDGPGSLVGPVPMEFKRVQVVAEGNDMAGIRNVEPDTWVVVVGQHLLEGDGEGRPQARVRAVSWSRIVDLQRLQQQDLLREFMEKQQRLAQPASMADSTGSSSAGVRTDSAATATT